MSFVKYPFGAADSQSLAFAAAIAATINNTKTVATIAQLTGAATLNLSINTEMPVGAELIVKVSADATGRTLTLGTGLTGNAQVLAISKSYSMKFEYDGTTFVHMSTNLLN